MGNLVSGMQSGTIIFQSECSSTPQGVNKKTLGPGKFFSNNQLSFDKPFSMILGPQTFVGIYSSSNNNKMIGNFNNNFNSTFNSQCQYFPEAGSIEIKKIQKEKFDSLFQNNNIGMSVLILILIIIIICAIGFIFKINKKNYKN